jgi:hypothetical protein
MKYSKISSVMAIGLLVSFVVCDARPAAATATEVTPTPAVGDARVPASEAIVDIAWSFAEAMGSTLSEATAGTWQTVEGLSVSFQQSVSQTWNETMRASQVATAETIAYAEGRAQRGPSGIQNDMVRDSWKYLKNLFRQSTEVAAPSSTSDWLSQLNDAHQSGFWTLLNDAGYKLKSIDSTIGLIPSVSFKYGYARELSEADKAWLERKLDRLAHENNGPISILQRLIIHGILEGNEAEGYMIENVSVSLLPLPKAQFSMTPIKK